MKPPLMFNHQGRPSNNYMFKIIAVLLFITISCRPFMSGSFIYHENGLVKKASLLVPKGYNRSEQKSDSIGNDWKFYFYSGGKVLYFARFQDSSIELQPIDMEENIPRKLYGFTYTKGIDSTGTYWRENRKFPFRSGYRYVEEGNDWIFDSSLNYFHLRN